MTSKFMIQVGSGFDIAAFVQHFANIYHAQGKVQNHTHIGNSHIVDINVGNEGFSKNIGLGANICVNFILIGDILHINFSGADWSGKIVAYFISPFLCGIPYITNIIGIVKQLSLPGKVKKDILSLLSGFQIR